MEISKNNLRNAFEKAGLDPQNADKVWDALDQPATLRFSHWLYYLGAFVIISAMTWLINLSWDWFTGGAILLLSIVYASIFFTLGRFFWKKAHLRTPAGLLITLAVCMTPLFIYGLGTYLKLIPQNGEALFPVRAAMTLGTILTGLIALRYYSFPFLTFPLFLAAWLFISDLTSHEELSPWTALFFGLAMILIAYVMEKRLNKDYAFWAYLFGGILFWFALTDLMSDQTNPVLILYLLVNIALMALSVLLQVTIFMVLGATGTFLYLGYLAYSLFGDSILFPITLGVVGLILIYGGILFQKKKR